MARDVFNRLTDAYGGSFSADGAYISFSVPGLLGTGAGLNAIKRDPGVGLLTQNLTIAYQQNILRLYEIGTNYHFFVAGRTSGQLSVQRILGPRPVSIEFYRKYGDVCNVASNVFDLTMASGCTNVREFGQGQGAEMTLRIMFLVINSLAINISAQDSLINENLQAMFASANWVDNQQSSALLARRSEPIVVVGGQQALTQQPASVSGAADSVRSAARAAFNRASSIFGGGGGLGVGGSSSGTVDIPPMPPAGDTGSDITDPSVTGERVPSLEAEIPGDPEQIPAPQEFDGSFTDASLAGQNVGSFGVTAGISSTLVAAYLATLHNWIGSSFDSLDSLREEDETIYGELADVAVAQLTYLDAFSPSSTDAPQYQQAANTLWTELNNAHLRAYAAGDVLTIGRLVPLLNSFPLNAYNAITAATGG